MVTWTRTPLIGGMCAVPLIGAELEPGAKVHRRS
jgi:hypothetical protein